MAKAHGVEMKPGDVHDVVGAKEVYRALLGDFDADSPKARRWLRAKGVPIYFLPRNVKEIAIAIEEP